MKKKVTALVMMFMIFVSSVTPALAMTEAEMVTYLNELTVSLAAIGSAISNSPDLTEAESDTLMSQLVAISSAIISIQSQFRPIPISVLDEYVEADNTRTTAKDAGLNLLTLQYNGTTKSATATLEFSTTTKTRIFTLVPPVGATYDSEVDLIIKESLDELAEEFGIRRGDMATMIRVSSRHPARDSVAGVGKNSSLANEMANNFGKHSIVTGIEVRPGSQKGYIDFTSDQEELLRLTLSKNYDSDGYALNTYKYEIDYYAPAMDLYSYFHQTDLEGNFIVPDSTFDMLADDIRPDEVIEFTKSITQDIPFASSISNFDTKLVRFLTDNSARYLYGSTIFDESVLDCYYPSDKTALSEFLLFILKGVDAKYNSNVVSTAKYRAPHSYDDYGIECWDKKRYF